MNPENKAELERYRDDAVAKMANVQSQIEAEKQAAADAIPPRKPFAVQPFSAVVPAVLAAALAEIKGPVDGPLAETIKTLGRVCRTQATEINVRSDQLLGVLALAGIGTEPKTTS